MVFHGAAMHHVDTVLCVYFLVRGNVAVFQCDHDGSSLESGAWFHHVRYGIVLDFAVDAVVSFGHVHDGFNLAGLYFHEDSHAYISVDFLQLVEQGLFGDVLHTHIDGGDDVTTIYRRDVYNIQVFVHDLLSMAYTLFAFQDGIVLQFQSIFGT